MSHSSILGGESAATRAAGRDADALGPSDSSDSGSDVQGERSMATEADNPGELGGLPLDLASDSDSTGTGERASATGDAGRDGADILPDHIVDGVADNDALVDADFSADVDDIADDDDVDADDESGAGDDRGDREARVAASSSGDPGDGAPAHGGRVFTVPAGTLDDVKDDR